MLLQERPSDFDVYFKDRATAMAVAKYYLAQFKTYKPSNKRATAGAMDIYIDETVQDRIKIVVRSAGLAQAEDKNKTEYQYFETVQDDSASGEWVAQQLAAGDAADVEADIADAVPEDMHAGKYRAVFASSNAITLTDKLQLVFRFYGTPEEIHTNYDFVHCTNFYTSWNKTLTLNPAALEALLTRELRYVGSKYPICSMIRVRKFIKRGFTINAGQMLKIAWQISELNLSNIQVLEEQLTGVDVAYFGQLIERLRQQDADKINSAYLCEIIERMF